MFNTSTYDRNNKSTLFSQFLSCFTETSAWSFCIHFVERIDFACIKPGGYTSSCLHSSKFKKSINSRHQIKYTHDESMDCSIRICVWKSPGGSNEQETTTTRASSSRRAPGRCGEERPEEKINWLLVLEMFFTNAASSVGTVGFVWATVVLLGGFVTKLNPVDFWFITTLSFFQAIRLVIPLIHLQLMYVCISIYNGGGATGSDAAKEGGR